MVVLNNQEKIMENQAKNQENKEEERQDEVLGKSQNLESSIQKDDVEEHQALKETILSPNPKEKEDMQCKSSESVAEVLTVPKEQESQGSLDAPSLEDSQSTPSQGSRIIEQT